jgi:3-deoxy-D-arabino-heptulosonate 7-phosphate (DAHP) synthase class II
LSRANVAFQGGDCAERFDECSQDNIEKKFKILLQMSMIIIWSSRVPVVRVARMAGQFAKPRTSDFETVNGDRIPSYKGDSINGFEVADRKHDPNRFVSINSLESFSLTQWLQASARIFPFSVDPELPACHDFGRSLGFACGAPVAAE